MHFNNKLVKEEDENVSSLTLTRPRALPGLPQGPDPVLTVVSALPAWEQQEQDGQDMKLQLETSQQCSPSHRLLGKALLEKVTCGRALPTATAQLSTAVRHVMLYFAGVLFHFFLYWF